MTQKQFDRAIELDAKLKRLYRAQKEIKDTINHRLSYIEKRDRSFGDNGDPWRMCDVDNLAVIGHILDRHDVQIRKEIEDEINQIKKEIETL